MRILLDNRGTAPIYEQIGTQIREQIVSGELMEDEALPSIRSLARDLRISVITTKRAYEELEAAGYIHTLPGKGSFVAQKNTELVREERLRQIEQSLAETARLAKLCGLNEEDILNMYRLITEVEE